MRSCASAFLVAAGRSPSDSYLVRRYIEFVADRLLVSLGSPKAYHASNRSLIVPQHFFDADQVALAAFEWMEMISCAFSCPL